jgi:hypothetical protein
MAQKIDYVNFQRYCNTARIAKQVTINAAYKPRLDAFGDVTYANPDTVIFTLEEEWNESWAVGLALSYTLNDSLAGMASGSELEANLRKA